jgi:hypothetical protein
MASQANGGAVNSPFSPKFFEQFKLDDLARLRNLLDGVVDEKARQFERFAPPPEVFTPADGATRIPKNDTLAEVLSPSQVNCFLGCSAKWYFKYFIGLSEVKAANLTLGRAVHAAVREVFKAKLAYQPHPEREDVVALFDAAWDAEVSDTAFAADEDPDELKRTGEVLAAKYVAEAVPDITPAAIEMRVTGTIGGVKVQGYIDLMDTNGRIIDLKTAAKKPSGIEPPYALQLATYREITPGASGKARLDTLVKTKTPQLVSKEYTVSEADIAHVRKVYPLAQDGMRAGLYFPNRGANMCSRKYCSFAAECEREFGGEVAE